MVELLSSILTVLLFTLACTTASRCLPILMLGSGYHTHEIAAVLIMKVLGNLISLIVFKKLFEKFGIFRLLTISIVVIVQVFILIFSCVNIYIYIFIFFAFGFFEQCAGSIIKPILEDYIPKYKKQFDLLFRNFIRLLSGLLLFMNNKNYIGMSLVSIITLALIPYVLNDVKNVFRKDYIKPYDSQLMFIYHHYNDYFISSFLHNVSSFILTSYLVIFLSKYNFSKAAMYMSFYLWGQFIFSYPFNVFINSFSFKVRPFALNGLIILMCFINVVIFFINPKITFNNINIFQGIAIALVGGAFSLSFKSYFKDIKKAEHEFCVDMTEDQIKGISALFGVVVGLAILQSKSKIVFFSSILLINVLNILHLLSKKWLKKL